MPTASLHARRPNLIGPVALLASVAAHAGVAYLAVVGWGQAADAASRAVIVPRDTGGALAGETFEIPTDLANDPEEPATPDDPGLGTPDTSMPASRDPTEVAHDVSPAPARADAPTRPRPSTAAPSSNETADHEGSGVAAAPARFGAIGDRAAVDLAAAFTRGFPQAASADPVWLDAPFGSAGTALVDLTLDESGAIVGTHATGTAGPALSHALRRTLALLRSRAFVATGRDTHLRVTATVTADAVHDGLHGEVFAIGGSFEGNEGSAFFALAVGRRVDIRIRVVR